jgi:hypothetical protein
MRFFVKHSLVRSQERERRWQHRRTAPTINLYFESNSNELADLTVGQFTRVRRTPDQIGR